jgi:peptide-methionine (S)-S-oxide reductase
MSRARRSAFLPFLILLVAAACARPEPVTGVGNPAPSPTTAAAGTAAANDPSPASTMPSEPPATSPPATTRELATFGNGCFWCSEAVLEQLDGVLDVTSGYAGGDVDAPTYEQVCTGRTGHAEVVQVTFDPARIGYDQLLDWFFKSHDPTTLNRQGADVGTQYRSVVFYHSEAQQKAALAAIARWQQKLADPIVTEVTSAPKFWSAEDYHQDYFRSHPSQGYCRAVIAPKLKKLGLDAK